MDLCLQQQIQGGKIRSVKVKNMFKYLSSNQSRVNFERKAVMASEMNQSSSNESGMVLFEIYTTTLAKQKTSSLRLC